MTDRMLVGGPAAGTIVDVPVGVSAVHVPEMVFKNGGVTRTLAESPEIRFDPDTWAIIAPPDMVPTLRTAVYRFDGTDYVYQGGFRD